MAAGFRAEPGQIRSIGAPGRGAPSIQMRAVGRLRAKVGLGMLLASSVIGTALRSAAGGT